MGEKTCRFCNQWKWKDFNKKNSLPYLKCLLHLSFVVYGPIYDRFTSVYVFFCKRFKPLYIEKTVYIKTHKTEWMLRNNADAHISSLGYLWYPLQYPNLVESKLNCKSKSWLPTPYRALVILLTRRLNPALSMVSPAWTFLQADTPTLFSRLFSSHDLSAGYYPVLTDACILLY